MVQPTEHSNLKKFHLSHLQEAVKVIDLSITGGKILISYFYILMNSSFTTYLYMFQGYNAYAFDFKMYNRWVAQSPYPLP